MASNMETIMPPLRENIKIDRYSHEYSVYGPNRSLIEWTRNSRLAEGILGQAKINTDVLFRAFGSQDYLDRIKASKEAIKSLWYSYPELGPYPLLDLLSEFQFENYFHPEYRDHVAHQLKVLLLGLYFFDECKHLQSRIMQEIEGESDEEKKREFIRRWIVCAVFHDIGYVIENDKGNETSDKAWQETRGALNESFKAPLSKLPDILSKGLSCEVEWHIVRREVLPSMTLEHPADIWQMKNEDDILKKLDDFGLRSGLAASGSPLRNYYDYAFSHKSKQNREKFWDHGIASALLLMRTWFHYRKFLEEFCKIEDDNLDENLMQYLNSLKSKVQNCEKSIIAAAGAMALHNIDPSLWDHGNAFSAKSLTLDSFRIILNGDDVQDPRGPTPMAFLLRLADILQDWGRSKFRASEPNEKRNLLDQDMAIQVDKKGKIKLFFPDDDTELKNPANSLKSKYTKALQELKSCLEEKAVSDLMSWGKPTWAGDSKKQNKGRTSPLREISFFRDVSLMKLAAQVKERLEDSDGSIANKYHYLGAHGAFAWEEVEQKLKIKHSARALLSTKIEYILKKAKEVSNGESLDIISLGTGTGQDDLIILEGLRSVKDYQERSLFTVDISLDLLRIGFDKIANVIKRDPVNLHAVCTDIEVLDRIKSYFVDNESNNNRLFHLLGLTLGNNKELEFLRAISKSMIKGDLLLLGVDFSADDKKPDGQLARTYSSYRNAAPQVDMFLSSSLKTAVEFIKPPEPSLGLVEAEGIWVTKNQKEHNYLSQNIKIETRKEEGLSEIEGTVSFTRYYTSPKAEIFNHNESKLCDYSHKYNSDAFAKWLVDNKTKLKLETVVDVKTWGFEGQYLVLLRRRS